MGVHLSSTLLCVGHFPQVPLSRNCKVATELRTCKRMCEMRRVPQPFVKKILGSFLIDKKGELGIKGKLIHIQEKISGDELMA